MVQGVANVDFILYVSAVATPQCDDMVGGEAETVAYAAHCQQEADLDRPVAGHTNICPGSISTLVEATDVSWLLVLRFLSAGKEYVESGINH